MKTLSNAEKLSIIQAQKDSALEFRKRRHAEWTETYLLSRGKVITNRLTQRQTVQIPLMKYGISTIMKDIDEPPLLYYDSLDNDEQKEIFYNEYYKEDERRTKLVLKDLVDKKQVMHFGRSFKKLNIVDGKFNFEIRDPQDILVDRFVDSTDIDSARCVIDTGLYRTLSQLEDNDFYDQSVVKGLKQYFTEESEGILEGENNYEDLRARKERRQALGEIDALDPMVGETYVELNEVYIHHYSEKKEKEVLFLDVVAVTGRGLDLLSSKPLEEVIGETSDNFWDNHFPFTTWAGDLEATDFWSDGPGDILREVCRVVNVWYSQLVENRTLRSFGMNYYNSNNPDFIPQIFVPEAWGWYPIPGNPNEIVQRVDVPDLSESLDEMKFVLDIGEKAVATSSTQQGAVEKSNVTLGEVQLALANAKERVKSLSVLYTDSWLEFGHKRAKMLEGASGLLEDVTITRKGRNGLKNYTRVIKPADWYSPNGYKTVVKMMGNKQQEDIEGIQKLQAVTGQIPNNPPLVEIYKRKLLEFGGLSADELKQVMDYEKQKSMSNNLMGDSVMTNTPPTQPQPAMAMAQSQPMNNG